MKSSADDQNLDPIQRIKLERETFVKVRRDCGLTVKLMKDLLSTTALVISDVERGYRRPSPKLKGRLRQVAFLYKLPYAVAVFPEADDPEQQECPACVALRRYRAFSQAQQEKFGISPKQPTPRSLMKLLKITDE